MKIVYITNARIPTEKAHGIQIMEMCAAFADLGHNVELAVPKRFNPIKEDPFVYHDVRKVFSIKYLPTIDLTKFGKIGFLVQLLSFAEMAAWYSFFKKGFVFYTRDAVIALYLRMIGKKVIWEGHRGERNWIIKLLIRLKIKMVVITEALKDLYFSMGVSEENIIVAADGADVDRFDIAITQRDVRKKLNLPLDKKIVLYKGHLYTWKGAGTLAEAAAFIKDKNTVFVFIGGTEKDIVAFKDKFARGDNVMILGNRPRSETPIYQKAADILVIPNSAKEDISRLYSSPMKLFSYMAGGLPIVASDLPSLREVLNERNAVFFTPDDPKSLAEKIEWVLKNENEAKKFGEQALKDVAEYSWTKRAQKIIDFVKNYN